LPAEAQQEAKTMAELRAQLAQAQRDVRAGKAQAVVAVPNQASEAQIKREIAKATADQQRAFKLAEAQFIKNRTEWRKYSTQMKYLLESCLAAVQKLKMPDDDIGQVIYASAPSPDPILKNLEVSDKVIPATTTVHKPSYTEGGTFTDGEMQIRPGALRMLRVLVSRYPIKLSKGQLGTFSKMKPRGGSFGQYISDLRRNGLIQIEDDLFSATQVGIDYLGEAPNPPQTPDEIIGMWRENLSGGTLRMFDALLDIHDIREGYTKEELGAAAGVSPAGGAFGTYLAILRSNGLIKETGGLISVSDNLFL
jgi:hypothetical protein